MVIAMLHNVNEALIGDCTANTLLKINDNMAIGVSLYTNRARRSCQTSSKKPRAWAS